jgi:hypothetical protein
MNWDKIPDQSVIDKVMAGMRERNFNPVLVPDRRSALEKLKLMIPAGAGVMTGASTTLEQIGFIEYLAQKNHPWLNIKDGILAEKDAQKQRELRRAATISDYFIGSVQAITESGQVVGADATGNRQGGYVYGAKNVIWVVGVNKIVSDLEKAVKRLIEHCVPLEDARMKSTGSHGTFIGKIVIYEREFVPQRISTILIKEKLGF